MLDLHLKSPDSPDNNDKKNLGDDMGDTSKTVSKLGFVIGPFVASLVFFFFRPDSVPFEATCVAALACWMAIWWATEAVHVAVASFLPMILFPVFGVNGMTETAASYAHPIVYLFLGGFLMAIAIQKSGLHQRVALWVFSLAGTNGKAIIGGFMMAAAFISMWISNTSTTLMMLPMAMSVAYIMRESASIDDKADALRFEKALFLGLAYGATMGGISTLVGTPPNAFMSGFMEQSYNVEIDFARWMIIGIPITVIMLPLTWFLLVNVLYPVNLKANAGTRAHLESKRKEIGSMSSAEMRVGLLFLILVIGWVCRKPIVQMTGAIELTDTVIAMGAALLAFVIPSGSGRNGALISWDDTKSLPWGVLVLFGGGLALAKGMTDSGLTVWLGQQLAPLGGVHIWLLIVCATLLVIFLTEMTSNLATTATFLPIMAALAIEMGYNPLLFVVPVTLAASFAFMLPVATPPNAIIFSSGKVSIPEMMRAGLLINLLSVLVLTAVSIFFVPIVFG